MSQPFLLLSCAFPSLLSHFAGWHLGGESQTSPSSPLTECVSGELNHLCAESSVYWTWGKLLFSVNMWDVKRAREHNSVLMPICRFFSDSLLQQQSKPGELTWLGSVFFAGKVKQSLHLCSSRSRPLTMFETQNLKLESFEFLLPFNSYQIMAFAEVDSDYSLISART